jgi:FlaG/FlaF family flagellin (archaellin)
MTTRDSTPSSTNQQLHNQEPRIETSLRNRGLSSVMAVILLMAISVTLAAITGLAFMGLPGQMQDAVTAGTEITRTMGDPGIAEVSWTRGGNADSINVTVYYEEHNATASLIEPGSTVTITENSGTTGISASGDVIKIHPASDGTSEFRVVILARAGDTRQVIMQETLAM